MISKNWSFISDQLLKAVTILDKKLKMFILIFLILILLFSKIRRSQQKRSLRNLVLRNFAKFRRKHLCQSLFCNKVSSLGLQLCLAQVFFGGFCEISKNTFFTEHICATASTKCLPFNVPLGYGFPVIPDLMFF